MGRTAERQRRLACSPGGAKRNPGSASPPARLFPGCAALHPGYTPHSRRIFWETMSLHFILVAGPLVRASSWEPTAECLRAAGCHVQVPDVLAHHHSPPSWSAWTSQLLEHIPRGHEPIVVGHSSASALVADLATRLPARGIIIVDGDVPPSRGAAFPVRPALHDFIKGLAEPDGMLPIWSRWFARDMRRMSLVGLDILARDAAAFARFETGLPRMHIGWFDDAIELANWDHIPAGFIQTSAIYDHASHRGATTRLANCEPARHPFASDAASSRDGKRNSRHVAST